MSVKIRLKRHGGRKRPFYRIVVSDSRSPRDGKFIDQVGTYDPKAVSGGVKIARDKVERCLKRGATPTQTVSEIIKREKRIA